MVKGSIFDIKKFAVHDGPGIRTSIFFKGCPLNCWWCHNPEGISPGLDLFYYQGKCMGCWRCIEVCTPNAITQTGAHISIDRESCTVCGRCADICPTGALKIAGRDVTTEEVMEVIRRSEIFYDQSGGGVTFSGGEPLMQPEFLKSLALGCQEEGVHTVLDTSGYASRDVFDSFIDLIDLFLYDLKFVGEEDHVKYTGVSNLRIKKNLQTLTEKGKELIIRFPLIPDITDTDENVEGLIGDLSSLSGIERIELLPYHNIEEKFLRLGKEYMMTVKDSPSDDKMRWVKERFEDAGFVVERA